jgi:hypothetical protein
VGRFLPAEVRINLVSAACIKQEALRQPYTKSNATSIDKFTEITYRLDMICGKG